MKKQSTKTLVLSLSLAVLVIAGKAMAIGPTEIKVEVKPEEQRDSKIQEAVKKNPARAGRFAAAGLPGEKTEYVASFSEASGNLEAFKVVIHDFMEANKASDKEKSEAVREFIELRSLGIGEESDLTPELLHDVLSNWKSEQKKNFLSVLKYATEYSKAEIAKGNKSITTQMALEEALKREGYLDAFNRFCKK